MNDVLTAIPPRISQNSRPTERRTSFRLFRFGKNVLYAVCISALSSSLINYISFKDGHSILSSEELIFLSLLHWLVVLIPTLYVVSAYSQQRDLFHPLFVGPLSYVVYHALFAPGVIADNLALDARPLYVIAKHHSDLFYATLQSYVVVFVGWIGLWLGIRLTMAKFSTVAESLDSRIVSMRFAFVGLAYILAGIVGNVALLGGIEPYIVKTVRFYELWDAYREALVWGGTKWLILVRFLPVGVLIMAYGVSLLCKIKGKGTLFLLLLGSAINLFLSNATGSRSFAMMTLFYSIIVFHLRVYRFTAPVLFGVGSCVVVGAYVLGILRGAAYFGTDYLLTFDTLFDLYQIRTFLSLYLTNFLGTLLLVGEVQGAGVQLGATAFAGVTGLLGGPTPTTTEMEMFYRMTGQYGSFNPRYGPPGELYFNFGSIGVIIGMGIIGIVICYFGSLYTRCRGLMGVGPTLCCVFAVMTAHFLPMMNLSYIPPYFSIYAVPFYLSFLIMRRVHC